jgi:TolB-like protein
LPEWIVSALVFFLVLGFPLALVFAWAFELTPDGIKLEKHVDRSRSITGTTGRKLDYLIIGVLAVALVFFAFDKWVLAPARDAQPSQATTEGETDQPAIAIAEGPASNSIAVLAFADLSPTGDQEYFSDGVSEEILNVLAQIPGLRVTSRSSAFSFKGKDVDIPTVAKRLGVTNILEGSVRKSGNRIRITAQLIDARTDTHLWSETYDRQLDDVFTVQDEIAAAISDALKVKLALDSGNVVPPTVIKAANTDAYDFYLQGRELIHQRGRENLEDAVRYLERSLRLDNNFAPAHAQLAIAISLLLDSPGLYGELSLEEVKRKAMPHFERALELEPNLAEAYAGLGQLAQHSGDLELAAEYGRKALKLNPSYSDARTWLYHKLTLLGEYQEQEATLKELLALDPMSISGRVNYAHWLGHKGRIEEGREVADQLLTQSLLAGYGRHADLSLTHEGKIAESLSWALKAHVEDPGNMPSNSYVVWGFMIVGEYDEARRIDDSLSFWVDSANGHFDEFVEATQRKMLLDPENGAAVEAAAYALYHAGRIGDALPLYERLRNFRPEGRPIGGEPTQNESTMRLALARRKAGDEAGALAAAQIARQDHAALNEAGTNNQFQERAEAMVAAFENDPDRAIIALKSGMENGLRISWFFDDPIFEAMRDEPGFIALQQELDVILAGEHDKVLQLICFNNPVPDHWQPLLETCEGVMQQSSL